MAFLSKGNKIVLCKVLLELRLEICADVVELRESITKYLL